MQKICPSSFNDIPSLDYISKVPQYNFVLTPPRSPHLIPHADPHLPTIMQVRIRFKYVGHVI